MKIGLIGNSGYIAAYIKERIILLKNSIRLCTFDCDEKVDYLIDLGNCHEFDYRVLKDVDYIIFTAAISSPDKCAVDYETCWKVNVEGTEYFIQKALEYGCRVLFFSSDAVFGAASSNGCIAYENSPTLPRTPYGEMKKHVEDKFKGNKDFKAIRLSYVVSARDRFVSYCLNCIHEGRKAEIYHPFYRNCVSVHDVVDVVLWLLFHWDNLPSSFLNVAGTELVSRLQMADEINCLMDGRLEYYITNPKERFYMNRTKITHMSSLYLYEKRIIRRRSFFELLQEELEGVQL